ncbi:MAG: carotenoid biosynthesis protein [Bacteroidales bacterium]|nr:carotenoid biosynthesis protein [Bacteroidales bacterium]MDD4683759.1 carotenoid biosynthesis protein [Bacteroidales bacterium]
MNKAFSEKDWFFIRNIIVFYVVGIIGFSIKYTYSIFIHLTPVVLLMSLALLFYYDRNNITTKKILFYVFIYISSLFIEMYGVNTGILFGDYTYGKGLGIKIVETPILIGINWVLMIYITSSIFTKLKPNFLSQVIIPSSLMIGYDIIMERAAPKIDMWSWANDTIPLQNFLMWGGLAILFHSIRYILKIEIKNKMATPIFIAQVLLFIFIILLK